jgi:multidrug efflux pump subunit AcrA (membrane-fusion protein)
VIDVPEKWRGTIREGTRGRFEPGNGGPPLVAVAKQVGAGAGTAGLYPVVFDVLGANAGGLSAGQRGEIILENAPAESGLIVPSAAIIAGPNRSAYVAVVDPRSGQVSRRTVVLGELTDGGVIVRSGLTQGMRVVAMGGDLLKVGEVVNPVNDGVRRFND